METTKQLSHTFSRSFDVLHIADNLRSFDGTVSCEVVNRFFCRYDLDTLGVRKEGKIIGYAHRSGLGQGPLEESMIPIHPEDLLSHRATLSEVIQRVVQRRLVFVTMLGEPVGIVASKDLQKPAVRMWLFGLLMISEVNMTRVIPHLYPNETWRHKLSEERLEKAMILQTERHRRKRPSTLIECLQFSDKLNLLTRDPRHREILEFESGKQARQITKNLELLRNDLAHNQNLTESDLEIAVSMIERLDFILSGELLLELEAAAKGK